MIPQGRPYYPISSYYKERFGGKVYKLSVSVADSCPNRQENGRLKPCIFCDEWGAAAYHQQRDESLADQIRISRERIGPRYRAEQFLVYFQAYTNTFDRVAALRSQYEEALAADQVVGLAIGTRPDCLPERVIDLLADLSQKHYLMIELGVQSFSDSSLQFLQRGHSAETTFKAIERLHDHVNADIGVHLIFGLPDESDAYLIETARLINQLPIHNVKLHQLHVLKKTPLAEIYQRGEYQPLLLEEYARRVGLFLRHLSSNIAVQRLAAVASRWDELLAPEWTKEKMRPTQFIEDQMRLNGHRQGDLSC